MSQVLFQPKPIAHSTSAIAHSTSAAGPITAPTIRSSTSSNNNLSNNSNSKLATTGSFTSTSISSSRPRRAAALASEATIQAVAASGRRKSSQSSSNKSNSHPSLKATPTTPRQNGVQVYQAQQEKEEQSGIATNKNNKATSQRVMAALPRSKRPRRGAAAAEEISTNNVAINGRGAELNGASKASILMGMTSLIDGYQRDQDIHQHQIPGPSTSSSTSKIGNGSGGSIKEMINGQETEVFVVDSTSPPIDHLYKHGDNLQGNGSLSLTARGKRKAIASPNTAINGASTASTASTIKKRKKEEVGSAAVRPAGSTWGKATAYDAPYLPDKYPLIPKNNIPSYRGGYNADLTYQSPNGTKWTDSIDNPYHPARWNAPIDDSEGHYIIREGNLVAGRYAIKNLLGQGTFGKVVRCKDTLRDREVAIKIIRSIQKYTDAAQIEIRVLKALRDHDPSNENKCIHLIDTFTYHNHVCIVSELLGKSVFDFLKENAFNPFPGKDIWSFAKQLLRSVAFLHELGLVHTDLKPENILLVDNDFNIVPLTKRANSRKRRVLKTSEIRLIDFGSATFNDEYHSQVVSTRHYRAPEIILQMGWSFPCDAWSIGCILIEFYTGEALFQTHDNLEHLAMMEMVLGPMPDDFRRKAETYRPSYFYANRLDFPNSTTNKQSRKYVKAMKPIDDTINSGSVYVKHDQRFKHLLRRLLTFDPNQRIRVDQALKHPYFDLLPSEIPS